MNPAVNRAIAEGAPVYVEKPASWVIILRATGSAVFETFDQETAESWDGGEYRAVPIGEYLASLNRKP